jgi:pyrroloquinoline-quinone synthase
VDANNIIKKFWRNNMNFINNLDKELNDFNLLTHEFYKDWSAGKLSPEILKEYSKQYYHHVEAFPRYISTIHSKCKDIKDRQILLGNLIEEEQGEENHPELWLRFAEGFGAKREEVKNVELNTQTQELIEGYFSLSNSSYAKGLGALYAYEKQVPEVAKSKIEGLKAFYGIDDERSLKFFNVHIKADEWHSEECANLIAKLSPHEQQEAREGAIMGAKLLWKFLDGMVAVCH